MDRKDLRKRLLKKAKEEIEENLSESETQIIKAVRIVTDLDEILNLMNEGISDWEKRAPKEEATKLLDNLKTNRDSIEEEKDEIVEFINAEMRRELPNFSFISGEVLGARLLAEAGSRRKLAFAPASTIQVLGAEKALFNHLKRKTKCPKHGHIFNHPLIQKLPKNKRGKASRILAGKLSIAAKLDYFGDTINQNLKKEVENKISKL
jgi:nucleolar protein 56